MRNRRLDIQLDEKFIWINGKAIPKPVARILGYLFYAVAVFLAVMLVIFVLLPLLGIALAFVLALAVLGAALMIAAPLYRSFTQTFHSSRNKRNPISRRDDQ